ncbi:EcsC family protein [Mangrovibacillus cuniculi]|uniref:EcsC family protein n=1 Tax=Mangrovibacillus cuniculi TaxID=2593652 RepID=A0A7S8HER4_9BACI|nr:EcsC family protein [Mangrovibacillus cuniculi]QPC45997.1 EcsC family protein [Mangrovibacillus cuniculi]
MEEKEHLIEEVEQWKRRQFNKTWILEKQTKKIQTKMNHMIPEKVNKVITASVKSMIETVWKGSKWIPTEIAQPYRTADSEKIISAISQRYKRTASLTGAGTGLGGIITGMADFPLLLSIKIRFLYEVANAFGYNVRDHKERLFVLHIFLFAFSKDHIKEEMLTRIENWNETVLEWTDKDWEQFQQEYRDHIDLVKLAQLLPGVGAIVGAVVNYRLLQQLAEVTLKCYQIRWIEEWKEEENPTP